MKFHRNNREHFDGTHDKRHQHRNQGNVQVIIELTNGFDKGPAIGAKHQYAIRRIQQAHTGGEQCREDENVGDGKTFPCLCCRDTEYANFGSSVKAQAKKHTYRIHLPTLINHSEQGTKETPH